ncbi:MAG: O-antigen ligase family protein, partial [Opitutaceae bacterium]
MSAWFSPHRETSMPAALIPLSAVCFAYVLRAWLGNDPDRIRRRAENALKTFVVFSACFVVVSHILWLAYDVIPRVSHRGFSLTQALAERNIHPLGHSIYTAGFALLALPIAAVLAATARGAWRLLAAATALLSLALIMESGSRGGLLGLLAMMALAAGILLVRARVPVSWKAGMVFGLLLAAVAFVALNPRMRAFVVHREWPAQAADSNRQRAAMIEAGILMGRDRPLLGQGPGTVSLTYPEYRANLQGGVDNVLQLHSTPAQLWAELGAPGLAAFALVAWGVVLAIARLTFRGSGRSGFSRDTSNA